MLHFELIGLRFSLVVVIALISDSHCLGMKECDFFSFYASNEFRMKSCVG